MSAMMTRSAARFWWGRELPREVASLIKDYRDAPWRPITWAQIHEERRQHQAEILRRRRDEPRRRAVRLSVRYFDIIVYTGWQVYIDGVDFSHWVRGPHIYSEHRELMNLFPMPQRSLFGGENDEWERWKEWFASAYQKGRFDRHPRGIAYCWALCDGSGYHTTVRRILERIT